MDGGRIVEYGNPTELLQRSTTEGYLRKMINNTGIREADALMRLIRTKNLV